MPVLRAGQRLPQSAQDRGRPGASDCVLRLDQLPATVVTGAVAASGMPGTARVVLRSFPVGDVTGADLVVFGSMLVGLMLAGVGIARDALATRRRFEVDEPQPPEEAKRAA